MVTMKDGSEWKGAPSIFIKAIAPLGYQKPAEFYAPKYELIEDKDISTRSTLYWNPIFNVEDLRELHINVPENSRCIVNVEGLGGDGECVYLQKN